MFKKIFILLFLTLSFFLESAHADEKKLSRPYSEEAACIAKRALSEIKFPWLIRSDCFIIDNSYRYYICEGDVSCALPNSVNPESEADVEEFNDEINNVIQEEEENPGNNNIISELSENPYEKDIKPKHLKVLKMFVKKLEKAKLSDLDALFEKLKWYYKSKNKQPKVMAVINYLIYEVERIIKSKWGSDKNVEEFICKVTGVCTFDDDSIISNSSCPDIVKQVCWINEAEKKTFNNSCLLEEAGAKKIYDWECKQETGFCKIGNKTIDTDKYDCKIGDYSTIYRVEDKACYIGIADDSLSGKWVKNNQSTDISWNKFYCKWWAFYEN